MFGFTPFILPAILNAPQLFRGDVGGYVGNVGIGGTTGNLLGNIVPGDVAGSALSKSPIASNIPSHLIGPQSMQQGLLSSAGNAASIGPNLGIANPFTTTSTGMAQTLAQTAPKEVIAYNPQSIVDRNVMGSESLGPDFNKYGRLTDVNIGETPMPNLGQVNKPDITDLATAGGYEEQSMMSKAFDKMKKYVEDDPINAALLGVTGAGAIYEGLKPTERPPLQPTLGPSLGRSQEVKLGAPLQVKRIGRR